MDTPEKLKKLDRQRDLLIDTLANQLDDLRNARKMGNATGLVDMEQAELEHIASKLVEVNTTRQQLIDKQAEA